MVFAFAGDSTMTSDDPPPLSAPLSISVTTFFLVRFAVVFRAAMSVYRLGPFRWRGYEPRPFDKRAQVIERNASLDLNEGALDDLLELGVVYRTRSREREKLPPCIGREAAALMWSKDSERHVL